MNRAGEEVAILCRIPGVIAHLAPNETEDGCWIWLGPRTGRAARPAIVVPGARTKLLARVVWSLAHGQPVPPSRTVLGKCGRKMCVRPSHLVAVPLPDRSVRPRERRALEAHGISHTTSHKPDITGPDGERRKRADPA